MGSKAPVVRQIYSVMCGHLSTISFGALHGWVMVNFVDLQKDDTTFPSGPITLGQATLLMSAGLGTSIIANLILPPIVKKIGCKRMLFAMGIPQIIVWLLIIFAQNYYYLFAARVLGGFIAAGLLTSYAIFVLDVCFDRIRGTLLSFFDPFMNLGHVVAFVLAKYFDYATQAKFLMIFPIVFVILFARIPESPQHLINVQKQEAANKAHRFYMGTELEKSPLNGPNDKQDDAKLTWNDFNNRRARKAMFIAILLMVLNAMQGTMVLRSYATEILTNSHSNISPIDASIGMTVMLIGANIIFMNLIDRVGRRTIYMWSSLACTTILIFYAAYLYYLTDNHAFDWVPVASVSTMIFVSALGMDSAPFIIMYEIIPKKIKNYCFPCCNILLLCFLFSLHQIFPLVKLHIGLSAWVAFFAVMSLCNALFAIFVVPETKGKSHETIMQMLDK